jgi:hypothetical protein
MALTEFGKAFTTESRKMRDEREKFFELHSEDMMTVCGVTLKFEQYRKILHFFTVLYALVAWDNYECMENIKEVFETDGKHIYLCGVTMNFKQFKNMFLDFCEKFGPCFDEKGM